MANHSETAQRLVKDFARALEADRITDDLIDAFHECGIPTEQNHLYPGGRLEDAVTLVGSAGVSH
ncbi:hypothetical protein COU80_04245 [Candidatus Peregrinibacteria bacterium CG10_big_fil_rev_8_21_14_0_10_55_24]|nr:MAG: hypothetical protein COU80_04245 [Candidatus Peregrinibacteria bacterium CG10_big_fil_rev_8_21_14_0_10_55_24]